MSAPGGGTFIGISWSSDSARLAVTEVPQEMMTGPLSIHLIDVESGAQSTPYETDGACCRHFNVPLVATGDGVRLALTPIPICAARSPFRPTAAALCRSSARSLPWAGSPSAEQRRCLGFERSRRATSSSASVPLVPPTSEGRVAGTGRADGYRWRYPTEKMGRISALGLPNCSARDTQGPSRSPTLSVGYRHL